MKTVSVVIPTYNRINFLLRAIDSILKQTYPIHQIIVVDNNSTDNTSEILRNKYSKSDLFSINNLDKEEIFLSKSFILEGSN